MANKAIEILRKAEHDLDVEIRMWKNQCRPEVATRCKIEKSQIKQAIEKLCVGESVHDASALPIPYVSDTVCEHDWQYQGHRSDGRWKCSKCWEFMPQTGR